MNFINFQWNSELLKKLTDNGHKLILFTMRSNRIDKKQTGDENIQNVTGQFLDDAVNWFKQNDIPLYGIQTHPTDAKPLLCAVSTKM